MVRRLALIVLGTAILAAPLVAAGSAPAARLPKGCVLKPHGKCAKANLAGRKLSGMNLTGINLSGARLTRANLALSLIHI